MIPAVLFLTAVLAGSGLVLGLVIALAIVIWSQDIESALWLVGTGYYVLVGLLPIALWCALLVSHDEAEYRAGYTTALRALLTTLQGAVVGSVLGAGPIFLAVVVNLPVILTDFETGDFGSAVRDVIIWSRLALAVGAAVASAIPLGWWAYYIGAGQGDES